ncbi:hypothetical protein KXV81_008019, partial [Aspergillus fumigatus]
RLGPRATFGRLVWYSMVIADGKRKSSRPGLEAASLSIDCYPASLGMVENRVRWVRYVSTVR